MKLSFNAPLSKLAANAQSAAYAQGLAKLREESRAGLCGFVRLPFTREDTANIKTAASRLSARCNHLVVLGIGGSSLGGQTISEALGHRNVTFLDTVDPDAFFPLVERLNMGQTSFFIVSKSGTTVETWAQWLALRPMLEKAAGAEWKSRVAVCTDTSKSPLKDWANTEDIPVLGIPSDVGGRYSVLTAVGLLPAAFGGANISALLDGAASLGEPGTWSAVDHPVRRLTSALFAAHTAGRTTSVLMPYATKLERLADWYVQLWAESLGKKRGNEGVGNTPLAALGVRDQHSQMQNFMQGPDDKVLGFVWNSRNPATNPQLHADARDPAAAQLLAGITMHQLLDAEMTGTLGALEESDKPWWRLDVDGITEQTLGGIFFLLEGVTAIFGYMLGINPLDQPGVERAKIIAIERLSKGNRSVV